MEKEPLVLETTNYAEVLKTFGLPFVPDQYYWRVGEITGTQGWILHLTGTRSGFLPMINKVIPALLPEKIPFKIARDATTVSHLLNGELGYIHLGKLMSIYPPQCTDIQALARELIQLTQDDKGPAIPTDRHLGGAVYTRYGSYNPMMIPDKKGQPVKHIYDAFDQLIPDPYSIPFQVPNGISWPFATITGPEPIRRGRLLNDAYYSLFKIKTDAKGDVLKALYFEHWWNIRSCLIKQGRKHMHVDEAGRDIQDRLQWQWQLYHALSKDIPMPRVFDYFLQDGDTYLAMAFINGVPLRDWLGNKYNNTSWRDLTVQVRNELIDRLVKIISIVQKLHAKGYVHRDITSGNFLIDKKGHIWLIDMELAWDLNNRHPDPPFTMGTAGYMSPQQQQKTKPTITDDIYAVGALTLEFFTNLYPDKFYTRSQDRLQSAIQFFTGEKDLAEPIIACLSEDPADRPTLSAVQGHLEEIRKKTHGSKVHKRSEPISFCDELLKTSIQRCLQGLVYPKLTSPKYGWLSPKQRQESFIGNAQLEFEPYAGWHTGVAGPMWLTAMAKQAGFDIKNTLDIFAASWNYVENNHINDAQSRQTGLYRGSAGMAMTMVEAFRSGLIEPDPIHLSYLDGCFAQRTTNPSLAQGLAGQGIALLNALPWLDGKFVTGTLTSIVDALLQAQLPDGSWPMYLRSNKKNDVVIGIGDGVAGIVLFLLASLPKLELPETRSAISRSLHWLLLKRLKIKSHHIWPIGSRGKKFDLYSMDKGMAGVVLVFIQAYQFTNDPLHKRVSEEFLRANEPHPVQMDLTLGTGLAGLGETYLAAAQAFKEPIWQERANWIANLLFNLVKEYPDGSLYWIPIANYPTTDLFIGNAGILHFLLGCYQSEHWRHVLWPGGC